MDTYGFEDFVGDKDVFYRDHFDRQPMVRPGAASAYLSQLPGLHDLDDLLALESAPPSYLRVSKGGKGVPIQAYTRTVDRGAGHAPAIDPAKVYELFRSGGTVTWNSLDHILPASRRLAGVFGRELRCPTEVALFMTPAGHDGFAPHQDSIDVFVLQVEGVKSWRVWDRSELSRGSEASYTLEELGEPALEVLLRPGDVLYIPHGTPHAATARGQIAMHLSVGAEPRRWRQLLRETVNHLTEDAAFDDFPALGSDAHLELAASLGEKLKLLQDQLAGVDVDSELDRLARLGTVRTAASPVGEFERLWQVDALGEQSVLRRTAQPLALEAGEVDGKAVLVVNGHRLAVPEALAEAVQALEHGQEVGAARLYPGVSPSRSVNAAQGLARLGLFEPAN